MESSNTTVDFEETMLYKLALSNKCWSGAYKGLDCDLYLNTKVLLKEMVVS